MADYQEMLKEFWSKHTPLDAWHITTKIVFHSSKGGGHYIWYKASILRGDTVIVSAHSEIFNSSKGDGQFHEQQAVMRSIEMLPD